MFCPKCGEKNIDNARFCKKCGGKLKLAAGKIEKKIEEAEKIKEPSKEKPGEEKISRVPKKFGRKFTIIVIIIAFFGLAAAIYFCFFSPYQISRTQPQIIPELSPQQLPEVLETPSLQKTPKPIPPLRQDILRVEVSSVLKDQYGVYSPENVIDGDTKTAWCEGVSGSGEGEWIEIDFYTTRTVSNLKIFPGYGETEKLFRANNRPRALDIEFGDKSHTSVELTDEYRMQNFSFPPKEGGTYLKISIKDVYKGTKYDDTCISEISFTND